jgi:hypothetical protein
MLHKANAAEKSFLSSATKRRSSAVQNEEASGTALLIAASLVLFCITIQNISGLVSKTSAELCAHMDAANHSSGELREVKLLALSVPGA